MNDNNFQKLLLDLVREIKSDMKDFKLEVNQRFDKMNQQFDKVYQRFEKVDQQFDKIDQRFEKVDQRFDKVDQRFEKVDQRFQKVDQGFEKVDSDRRSDKTEIIEAIREEKHERERMEEKLDKVYESRNNVQVTFGWQWGMVSLFIATIAVGISKIFI